MIEGTFTVLDIILLIIGGIFIVIGIKVVQLWKLHKGLEAIGPEAESLLKEMVARMDVIDAENAEIQAKLSKQEAHLTKSIQRIGLVRYKAFEDQGGDQSFSIALMDQNGDGFVITSIAGIDECRVYAKPLVKENSTYALSQEEKEAIIKAKGL